MSLSSGTNAINLIFHQFFQKLPEEINSARVARDAVLNANEGGTGGNSASPEQSMGAAATTAQGPSAQQIPSTSLPFSSAEHTSTPSSSTIHTNPTGVSLANRQSSEHSALAAPSIPTPAPISTSTQSKPASQNTPTPPTLYHQQKFHYKSSKQSYLFECLQYYERLLDEDQMNRSAMEFGPGGVPLLTRHQTQHHSTRHYYQTDESANSSQGSHNAKSAETGAGVSSVEPVIPQWSLNLYSHWSGDKRVIYMLQLGNVYLEYGHYAEANYWLHATKALCQQIISSQSYDPYLEFLFTETQYSLACTLFNAQHIEEAAQYLEATYQRVVNLIGTFMHPFIRLNMQDDLAYNIIMLYIKILLQAALHQSNHDTFQFSSILVNQSKNDNRHHLTLRLLQKAMNLFMVIVEKDHNNVPATDPVTNAPPTTTPRSTLYISNFYHRKNTIHLFYLIAKHLNQLDFDMLAKDYLDKIMLLTNSTLHTSHSLLANVTSLSQQLQKQFATQQQRLRVVQPSKQQSKLSILSQFTEEETDDEDDWSYDEEDEDEDEGLSSRLRNRLTTTQQPSPSSGDEPSSAGVGAKSTSKKSASQQRNILKDSIFPDKFRFFKSRDLSEPNMERKVLASMFFSLRLPNGKQKFDTLSQHREWLANIVTRHNLDPATHSTNENIIVNNFLDDLRYVDEFSIPWAIKYYETCEKLFHISTPQSFQQCNEILVRFFTMLPEAKMTENIDVDDLKNYVGLFNIGIELLRIAALTVYPQNREEFAKMKNNLQQFYPKYEDYVTLIDIEALCHNVGLHSTEDERIISTLLTMYEKYHTMLAITPSISSTKLEEENLGSAAATSAQRNSGEMIASAASRSGGTPASATETPNANVSSATNSSIPNTKNTRPPVINSLYHIRQGYELACQSILILHHYLCHLSPITRAPLQGSSPTTISSGVDFSQHAENNMMDIHHRMQVLQNLYKKIPYLSSLKARAAFTIGNYFRITQRNLKMAERALFESVYIFDQVSSASILSRRPPILSLFGLCALSEYAETLLERNKYSVASICFDNLVFAHTILYGEHNYKLINKLAVLCAKNNDWSRSAQYILILLEKAQSEKNIPKVVFLSEKLSREYMERGDFRNAEHYISDCVAFLEEENARSSVLRGRRDAPIKTDLELKLQLKLAHLFLQGYYFERGIDLLAKLMDQKLTPIQKCQVLLELSEAYLKKRWLKESEIVLEKLVKHLQTHHIILGNLEVFNHVSMLQVASRLYYRKGQYALSLFCVNTALQQCDPSHLPRFANLFRLKGKIFHAISSSSSNISFPTTIEISDTENSTSRLIISLFQTLVPRQDKGSTQFFDRSYFGKRDLYRSSSEALNDALKYYEKAAFCYNAINDCINVTRIHLLVSRAQIEYLFAPMAFLQCKRTVKFFNNEFPDQEFAIDLQAIENEHVVPAIEVSVNTTSIMLALDSYITMAELRYLQGRKMSSQEYWAECLHILFTLFMKGTQVVVRKGAPPGFLERILNVVKRLVRLMFCYHKQFVNDNLAVIDALLMLERELLQVLKRHNDHDAWASTPFDFDGPISGSSTTSSVSSSISTGNASSTDYETISHLIKQNKVYQALPCNHSVSKSKSLPFLRRRKKKGSLKKLSLSSLRSRSTGADRSLSGSMTEDALTMSERVNERIWGCFFRMKQHQRKFSSQNITQQELGRRNQESMRRLWNLMKALREKVDANLTPTDDSLAAATAEDDDMHQIDEKIRRLSLESADTLVVNCLYKTIGSQRRFKYSTEHRDGMQDQQKHFHDRRHPSLPSDISFIKLAGSVVDDRMLQRLVYIIRLDDIIVYYLPFTGERRYQKFGGRDLEGEGNVMWIDNDINEYIESVLTQGRRKKMKTGEDDTALHHMTQLFHEAPFTYHPPSASDEDDVGSSLTGSSQPISSQHHASHKLKVPKFKKKMIPSILQSAVHNDSLYLIVSHHLQVIPWESLFVHFSARHFTLQGLIDRTRQNLSLSDMLGVDNANPTHKLKSSNSKFKPCFFMLYSEDEPRFIMPLERDRKAWIYSDLIYELSLTPDKEKPSIVHDILPNLPLHAPVIKYGKRPKSKSYRAVYKPINFIQLSRIAQNTHNIFTQIESHLNQHQYPVFIFTFGDLVDLSECIHYLVNYRRDCTLLFIPEKYIIHATKTICLMQKSFAVTDVATAAGGNNGVILNQSIQWLRRFLHIPVACVNPPAE